MLKGTLWMLNKLDISQAVIGKQLTERINVDDAEILLDMLHVDKYDADEHSTEKRKFRLLPYAPRKECERVIDTLKNSYGTEIADQDWTFNQVPMVVFRWPLAAKKAYFARRLQEFKDLVEQMDADLFMSSSDQLEDMQQAITETWHDEVLVAFDQYHFWDDAMRLVNPGEWYVIAPMLQIDY